MECSALIIKAERANLWQIIIPAASSKAAAIQRPVSSHLNTQRRGQKIRPRNRNIWAIKQVARELQISRCHLRSTQSVHQLHNCHTHSHSSSTASSHNRIKASQLQLSSGFYNFLHFPLNFTQFEREPNQGLATPLFDQWSLRQPSNSGWLIDSPIIKEHLLITSLLCS